jgi:hypothetical protein
VVLIHQLGDAQHGLFGFALVVVDIQFDLLSQEAAVGIDLVKRDEISVLDGLAKCRLAPRQGQDDADLDCVLAGSG